MPLPHPMLAENALFHTIGQIFHPVFVLFANLLAYIYGVVPNYAIAIAVLTVIVMAVLTPLTVKSTKSMLAMQELQPEIKKLQQKYKGADNREQLNQEMMRLYKEKGVNPASGCIPMLLQMPFLIVLYDMIEGLTHTTGNPPHAAPEYISHNTRLYHDLVHSGGQMVSFGMNFAARPFSHHPSIWAAIPFFGLVIVAVALQYFQMSQMTRRNPQAAQANKQMQKMQKFMPLLMAYIYFIVPAAVVVYMIVSTIIRIGTQDIIFRTGIVKPAQVERSLPAGNEDAIPARSRLLRRIPTGVAALVGGSEEPNKVNGSAVEEAEQNGSAVKQKGAAASVKAPSAKQRAPAKAAPTKATQAKAAQAKAQGAKTNGAAKRAPARGRRPGQGQQPAAGQAPKQHPRSKSKRARKAR